MYRLAIVLFLVALYLTSVENKSPNPSVKKTVEAFAELPEADAAITECSHPGHSVSDCYLTTNQVPLDTAPVTRGHQLLGGKDSFAQITNNIMSSASNLCDDPVGLGYLQLDEMCFSDFVSTS